MSLNFDFDAVLERHQPDLPVYVLVPAGVAEGFGAAGTFVVQAAVNGQDVGRRSIKPWGDGRWFMELTKAHCKHLGLEVGAKISVAVTPALETPPELEARIAERGLTRRWSQLTQSQRRAYSESVFEAKKPETREARIARIVAALRGQG